MYDRNYTDIVRYLEYRTPSDLQMDHVNDIGNPQGSSLIECKNGWNYEKSMYPNTVAMEVSIVY